jgi:oligopeptide/dipeptide ABC transporter ATP-binding protein
VILYKGWILEKGRTEEIYNDPRHPYTKMLMTAVPRLDRKWEKAEIEFKTEPSNHIAGCVYYKRCPLAYEKCCARPPLIEIAKGHSVACWKQVETNR